ncbi:MAG TPA: hypothetical protein VN929_16550 [Burkholderiales bacterium]|nr:hypothetical protein [Burkholderiales bacterium]
MPDASPVEFGGDHRMRYSPFVHPITANGARCVKGNELRVRDGRVAERSKLAELQRVGDAA